MEPLTLELRTFIVNNFLFGEESGRFSFSNDDSLQERGIVDSTGILELVCHLEEQYAIVVADEDLVPDNFDSVSKVARFVDRKRRAPGMAGTRAR
jgi:acyl carrier protein